MSEPAKNTSTRIVEIAEARSTAARARLLDTLSQLHARLSPKALAQEAAANLMEKGKHLATGARDVAINNPVKTAGIVAGIGLFLARRPLFRLLQRQVQRDEHATAAKSIRSTATSNRPRAATTRTLK